MVQNTKGTAPNPMKRDGMKKLDCSNCHIVGVSVERN